MSPHRSPTTTGTPRWAGPSRARPAPAPAGVPPTASAVTEKKEDTMSLTLERLRSRLDRALRDETGASTAEYAITVLAACGFAAVLVALLASGEVRELLMGIITSALSKGS